MLGMSDGDAADLVIDYGALADNLEVERKHLFASFNVSGSLVDQIGYETTEAFLLLHEAGHCRRGSSGRSYADQFAINTIRRFDGALGDKVAAAVIIWRKAERDPGHRTANFIDKPDVLARLDRVSRPVLLASSME